MTRSRVLPFHEGRTKFSVAHLIAALAAMFVVLPFADQFAYGHFIESIAFTVVLLASVSAVGGRKRTLLAAAILVVPAVLGRWLNHLWPGTIPLEPSLLAALVFVAFVIWHLLRFVMTAPSVNAEVICAAISSYLLFAVAFSFLHTLVASVDPNAYVFTVPDEAGKKMAGFTALYFSVESMTTVAYGDILPVSNVARMLVLLQAVLGMFYMTILVARLVALYSSGKAS